MSVLDAIYKYTKCREYIVLRYKGVTVVLLNQPQNTRLYLPGVVVRSTMTSASEIAPGARLVCNSPVNFNLCAGFFRIGRNAWAIEDAAPEPFEVLACVGNFVNREGERHVLS